MPIDKTIPELTEKTVLTGTEQGYIVDGANDRRYSFNTLKTWLSGFFADATATTTAL
jgi:hypothetical protein